MDLKPHTNAYSVYLPSRSGLVEGEHTHILYIPGNPGCIAYYHKFLALLQEQVASTDQGVSLSICGFSLPNFVDDEAPRTHGGRICSLQEVISWVEAKLHAYVHAQQAFSVSTSPIRVIIMGHSLGTYIGIEIIRRWQEQEGTVPACQMKILGYIGLWATVTWLAKSKSGRISSTLLNIPGYVYIASTIAKLIVDIVPASLLLVLVKLVTGFPDESAIITRDFLKSRLGLRQALYMARDELNEICEDRWSDNIWGRAALAAEQRPKLVFYFGAHDHWVANEMRDELIAARGRAGDDDAWKPIMEIDSNDIPHAFCIRHSRISAEIAARHVLSILRE